MGLRIVNTDPGVGSSPKVVEKPIVMGLRSELSSVLIGSFNAAIGFSGITHRGVLPEADFDLAKLLESVNVATVERRRPNVGSSSRSISSGNLSITKQTNSPAELCIYEMTLPIERDASIMAYCRLRHNPLVARMTSPDWCSATNVTGLYFGLEHGTHNTACYTFLTGPSIGPGNVVIGGPLQYLNSIRPGQSTIPFDWTSVPSGGSIELWIYFNSIGRPSPFVPPNVSSVEVWGRLSGSGAPQMLSFIPVGSLGTFPSQLFFNYRSGPSDKATLFLGNAGMMSDSLIIEDWTLLPDYRRSVVAGVAARNHSLSVVPDLPITYEASSGLKLVESYPSRWFPLTGAGYSIPTESFVYQPGRRLSPQSVSLSKSDSTLSGVFREEPRLESLTEGAFIEFFGSASTNVPISISEDVVSSAVCIEDGLEKYHLSFLETSNSRSVGLRKSDPGSTYADHHVSTSNIDWRSLKLYRLSVDRIRSKVSVSVDEESVLEVPMSLGNFPASSVPFGRVSVGNLTPTARTGAFTLSFLNYGTRYVAWESEDAQLPDVSPSAFTLNSSGSGTSTIVPASPLIIEKSDVSVVGSTRNYFKSSDFDPRKGILVDTKFKVRSFRGPTGRLFDVGNWTGAGIRLFLGSKRLDLSLFDCGIHGRRIGIIPSEGANEILRLTALGASMSYSVNPDIEYRVRLQYKAYDSIKVWIGSVVNRPSIVIPWPSDTGEFNLPEDNSPQGIAFGHFNELTSSTSEWSYLRWGVSNGYDAAITQQYPNGYMSYLFGGKALIESEFDE